MHNPEILFDGFGPEGFSEKNSSFKYPPLGVSLHPEVDLLAILNAHGVLSVHRLDGTLVWWRQLDSIESSSSLNYDKKCLYWTLDGILFEISSWRMVSHLSFFL